MTSHTPQPPAGDLVARLRKEARAYEAVPNIRTDPESDAGTGRLLREAAEALEVLTQHTEPVAGEVVAWQWSDFSGKWYTPDTARLPLHQQEELARMLAADHGGRVRPLYAALSGAEEK